VWFGGEVPIFLGNFPPHIFGLHYRRKQLFIPKIPQTSTRQYSVTYPDAVVPKLLSFFQLIFFFLQVSSLTFVMEVLGPQKTLSETKLRVLLETY
jgi:hypothetical protein